MVDSRTNPGVSRNPDARIVDSKAAAVGAGRPLAEPLVCPAEPPESRRPIIVDENVESVTFPWADGGRRCDAPLPSEENSAGKEGLLSPLVARPNFLEHCSPFACGRAPLYLGRRRALDRPVDVLQKKKADPRRPSPSEPVRFCFQRFQYAKPRSPQILGLRSPKDGLGLRLADLNGLIHFCPPLEAESYSTQYHPKMLVRS